MTTTATDQEAPQLSGMMADSLSELVDGVAQLDRMLATAASWRAELIDRARQWSELAENAGTVSGRESGWSIEETARRVLVSELACALRVPERTAESLIEDSRSLLHELPATFQALASGEIGYRHAQRLIDHARSLPEGSRQSFERDVLPEAKTLTVAQFEHRARRRRERLHPESIEQRHASALSERHVEFQPARDGMAWMSGYLSAAVAESIDCRLGDIATRVRCDTEPRNMAQLRADAFADLLLGRTEAGMAASCATPPGTTDGGTPAGADRGTEGADSTDSTDSADSGPVAGIDPALLATIKPTILVTVPVLTLLRHSDEPAELEGYGPIDAQTARRLAAGAPSFLRILTHPETGAVLSVGREHYAVPRDLRRWLRVRDETCRFPGCRRAAAACDIDHTTDWQFGGTTSHDNIGHLCPRHHAMKHRTAWSVAQHGEGVFDWTAPSGRRYRTTPAVALPGRQPGGSSPGAAAPPG